MNNQLPAGRVPPYDQEAETAVIGSILLANSVLTEVRATLRDEHFYVEAHRRIFKAIISLANEGHPVDAVTLGTRLRERGDLERVGGAVALASLTDSVVTTAHVSRYAGIVREKAAVRDMIHVAQEIVATGYAGRIEDVKQYLAGARSAVTKSSASLLSGNEKAAPLDALYKQIWREVTEGIPTPGLVKTGIDLIDTITGGMYPGIVILLGARPGMGKSGLALNILMNVALQGLKGGFMSLEDTSYFAAIRALARFSDIDSLDLMFRNVSPEKYDALLAAVNRLTGLPFWVDESRGQSVTEIHAKSALHKEREGLDFLVIDHLLKIKRERRESTTAEVTAVINEACEIASELGIPVLLLHQLSRALEVRPDKRPILSDLMNTGAAEADARGVWFLYRDGYYNKNNDEPRAELNIAKANQGKLGMIPLHADLSRMYFRGWDMEKDGDFYGDSQPIKQTPARRGGTYDKY